MEIDPGIDPKTGLPWGQAPLRYGNVEYSEAAGRPVYKGLATGKGYAQDAATARLAKVRYPHDAMIDVLLAEPTITGKELAKRMGYSSAWVYRIIGSDSFQAALAKRRGEVIDPLISQEFEEKLSGLAHQSLEVIAENLSLTNNIDTAFKALEVSTKAMGFGARFQGNNPKIENNFVVQLPGKAGSTEEWARAYSPPGEIIDQPPAENVSTTVSRPAGTPIKEMENAPEPDDSCDG